MTVSLQHVAISEDPIPVLKQMASAGGFTNVYVGYANKTAKFSDPTGVPADYDPTGSASALQEQATGLAVAVGHFRV